MKKLIIIILLSFSIFSCSGENKNTEELNNKANETIEKPVWVIKDSTDIINGYVDTLEWTIVDAKNIKNSIESDQNKLKNELNSIK